MKDSECRNVIDISGASKSRTNPEDLHYSGALLCPAPKTEVQIHAPAFLTTVGRGYTPEDRGHPIQFHRVLVTIIC